MKSDDVKQIPGLLPGLLDAHPAVGASEGNEENKETVIPLFGEETCWASVGLLAIRVRVSVSRLNDK